MSGKARLDRLIPGLSARKRAVLAIRALQADEIEDPAIRATMPSEQGPDFNEYLTLANGVIRVLLPHALVLQAEAETVQREMLLLAVFALRRSNRRLSTLPTLAALDAEGPRLKASLRQVRDDLHDGLECGFAPNAPDLLLPAFAERMGMKPPGESHRDADRRVVDLAVHLERQIPRLRSWLMTIEAAANQVVEMLGDECVIPAATRGLLQQTHQLLDEPSIADLYLGELLPGEIDEVLAQQLHQKLRDN